MYLRHAFAAVILVLSVAAPVAAGPLEDGEAAYQRGDYSTALRLLRPLAEHGDAHAQFDLGVIYNNGRGVLQNFATAYKWFSLAAAQGDQTAAQYRDIVQQSMSSAQTGPLEDGEAAYQRGDYSTALRLLRPLAEHGDAHAEFDLGVIYYNGRGVPQDFVTAEMWFNLAAAQGDQTAAQYRDTVQQGMSSAQVAEAQKLAREWKPTKPGKGTPTVRLTKPPPR